MKFYVIGGAQDLSWQFLRKAAMARGLEFLRVDESKFDYTLNDFDPSEPYLLYRVSVTREARKVEKLLMTPLAVTFYRDLERAFVTIEDRSIYYQKHGLPMPRTVCHLTSDRRLLDRYVAYLGGFPVIIKALGGSHGVGVMKVDSSSSLYSVVDFLLRSTESSYVLKEYIPFEYHARLIVLGSHVVDSVEYVAKDGDFRTNATEEPVVHARRFPAFVERAAEAVVSVLGVDFGGVDILVRGTMPYIAEANFPCFFPRCQTITGVDIAGKMVDFLLAKALMTHVASPAVAV